MVSSVAGNVCSQCQHVGRSFDRHCTDCGTKLPQDPRDDEVTNQAKDHWIAVLLNGAGFNDPEAPGGTINVCDAIYHSVVETKYCPDCGKPLHR